jgi:Fe-S-cluster containining protein
MSGQTPEWFARPDAAGDRPGLRFACTMCGNCCTGPEGYVLFTEEEGRRLADRVGVSYERFLKEYTKPVSRGVSLKETPSPYGLDCVFLDRTSVPGRAICGVYEDRPAQCRTWPFWPSVVRSRRDWEFARRTCPGIGRGNLIPPERIRVLRDTVEM